MPANVQMATPINAANPRPLRLRQRKTAITRLRSNKPPLMQTALTQPHARAIP